MMKQLDITVSTCLYLHFSIVINSVQHHVFKRGCKQAKNWPALVSFHMKSTWSRTSGRVAPTWNTRRTTGCEYPSLSRRTRYRTGILFRFLLVLVSVIGPKRTRCVALHVAAALWTVRFTVHIEAQLKGAKRKQSLPPRSQRDRHICLLHRCREWSWGPGLRSILFLDLHLSIVDPRLVTSVSIQAHCRCAWSGAQLVSD